MGAVFDFSVSFLKCFQTPSLRLHKDTRILSPCPGMVIVVAHGSSGSITLSSMLGAWLLRVCYTSNDVTIANCEKHLGGLKELPGYSSV